MSLTGSGFLFLVAALTVTAFVTLVVVWPALAGPVPARWRRGSGCSCWSTSWSS